MVVSFGEHFWGEKHMGFSVLYQGAKGAQGSAKELGEFLKDRVGLEEEHSKHLAKSLTKVGVLAASEHSLRSLWGLTKTALERQQQGQARLTSALGDLAKDVGKYQDELGKKHKGLKDQEHPTFDAVNLIQTTTTCLQKAKETYTTRCVEAERLRRDPSTAAKELTKAQAKTAKAREEYKTYLGKYEEVRSKFTGCLEKSAGKFQELETAHVERMRVLLGRVARAYAEAQSLGSSVAEELAVAMEHLDKDEVLQDFCSRKGTGTERPGAVDFEEPDLDALLPPALPAQPPPGDAAAKPPSIAPSNGLASSAIGDLNAAFTPSVPSLLSLDSNPANPSPASPANQPAGRNEAELVNLGPVGEDVASVTSSTSSSTTATKDREDSVGGTGSRSKLRLQFGNWSKRERASPSTTPSDPAAPAAAAPASEASSGGTWEAFSPSQPTSPPDAPPPPPPLPPRYTRARSEDPRTADLHSLPRPPSAPLQELRIPEPPVSQEPMRPTAEKTKPREGRESKIPAPSKSLPRPLAARSGIPQSATAHACLPAPILIPRAQTAGSLGISIPEGGAERAWSGGLSSSYDPPTPIHVRLSPGQINLRRSRTFSESATCVRFAEPEDLKDQEELKGEEDEAKSKGGKTNKKKKARIGGSLSFKKGQRSAVPRPSCVALRTPVAEAACMAVGLPSLLSLPTRSVPCLPTQPHTPASRSHYVH